MSRRGKVAVFSALFMFSMGIFFWTKVGIADFIQVEAASAQGVVTVSSLNVRKGPGPEYDSVTQDGMNVYLFENDVVNIMDEKNNFYKVKFTYNKKTVTGYSNKAYIKLLTPTPNATTKPTVKPTTKPTVKPTTKPTIKPTTKPTVKPTSSPSNVIIKPNNVPNAAVKNSTKTVSGLNFTGKVTASALRVRTKASTSADELAYKKKKVRLYKGNKVTVTQQKIVKGVVWYYVKFIFENKTLKGYVLSDYIKLTFAKTVKGKIYSTAKVYVRNSAGVTDDYLLQDDKKVSLKDGKSVKVLKEANANSKKWFRVSFNYNGEKLKGYILANLVAFQVEQTATPSPSPTVKPTTTPKVTVKPANTITPTATITPITTTTAAVKPTATVAPTQTPISKGEVNNGPLNVRLGAGKDYDRLIYNGEYVSLPIGHIVQIVKEVTGKTENWYYVEFCYNEVEMKGYVMAQYVTKLENNLAIG
ncbi:MAG: SH3 domain-containing protein [Clostridiales bacterium]|nr:SH3 domain-containing protein [Clostridiales bacterium]